MNIFKIFKKVPPSVANTRELSIKELDRINHLIARRSTLKKLIYATNFTITTTDPVLAGIVLDNREDSVAIEEIKYYFKAILSGVKDELELMGVTDE